MHPGAVLVQEGKEAVVRVSHVINTELEGVVAVLKIMQSHLKVEHRDMVGVRIGTWLRRIPTKSRPPADIAPPSTSGVVVCQGKVVRQEDEHVKSTSTWHVTSLGFK